MRYKITKKPSRYNEEVTDYYYIMVEVKKWFNKEPKWKHVKENGYAGWHRVNFRDLTTAEDYIKKMIQADNTKLEAEDVKIYDTREKVIDDLLKDE